MGRPKKLEAELKKHKTFRVTDPDFELIKNYGNGKAQKGFDLIVDKIKKDFSNGSNIDHTKDFK